MSLADSFQRTLAIVAVFWFVKLAEIFIGLDLYFLGLYPRQWHGIIGIFTSPFLHGDYLHLISNSVPFILLGTSLLFFYSRVAYKIFALIYLFTGIGVWIFARSSYHIGASGLVYGFASFLFFSGIFRKNMKALMLSFIVALLYNSMLQGIFPIEKHISWESHLIGAIVGMINAFLFRNVKEQDELEKEFVQNAVLNEYKEGYQNIENQYIKYIYKENPKRL
jgi:membrane associated rhomboid family serine protease